MSEKSKLFILSELYASLSPAEKKISKFILENTFEIIDMTIEELAEKAETSVASVSRFTKKMGFDNFYHLKLGIAKEFVNPTKKIPYLEYDKEVSIKEIYELVSKTNSAIIEESINNFKVEELEKIANLLLKANHIYFFAMGASAILAEESWYKFVRLGLKCSILKDYHSQLLQASILDENDIALVFSHSGINKDVLTLMEIINSTAATSIGITNYAKTPFHQSVDICLYFTEKSNIFEKAGFSSRIPQLVIIEALYRILILKREEKGSSYLKKYESLFKKRSL